MNITVTYEAGEVILRDYKECKHYVIDESGVLHIWGTGANRQVVASYLSWIKVEVN